MDVNETFDLGVASLAAHHAYNGGLDWEQFDPAEFLEGMSGQAGARMGLTRVTTFEMFSMGWGE